MAVTSGVVSFTVKGKDRDTQTAFDLGKQVLGGQNYSTISIDSFVDLIRNKKGADGVTVFPPHRRGLAHLLDFMSPKRAKTYSFGYGKSPENPNEGVVLVGKQRRRTINVAEVRGESGPLTIRYSGNYNSAKRSDLSNIYVDSSYLNNNITEIIYRPQQDSPVRHINPEEISPNDTRLIVAALTVYTQGNIRRLRNLGVVEEN